jgi:hypothetical protein
MILRQQLPACDEMLNLSPNGSSERSGAAPGPAHLTLSKAIAARTELAAGSGSFTGLPAIRARNINDVVRLHDLA